MALRGLIFDFDGLIVDTETATLDAWRAVHREDGLEGDPAVLHQVVGHAGIDADLWVAYPPDRDRDQLETRYFAATRAACRSSNPCAHRSPSRAQRRPSAAASSRGSSFRAAS